MPYILGVKFQDFGPLSYFDGGEHQCRPGDQVLVETEQGQGLARVALVYGQALPVAGQELRPILRPAEAADLAQSAENAVLGRQAHHYCRRCINERGLDMKLVDVEVFHDRSKMLFYFTAPGRVDFRDLVKDLVREYRTRIELRQIGVRHETQMLGAVGNCGQVCCCRRFMRKFDPVTIKMAKEQNLFLNPTKISGICGRLLCCLNFEQQNYEQFQRRCPRMGKKFTTVMGVVKVIRSNFFRETITVLTETNEERELPLDGWEAQDPRPYHGTGAAPVETRETEGRGRPPRRKGREAEGSRGESGRDEAQPLEAMPALSEPPRMESETVEDAGAWSAEAPAPEGEDAARPPRKNRRGRRRRGKPRPVGDAAPQDSE